LIAVDTNLLVYAHRVDAQHHRTALQLIESLRTERSPWAIPWPCVHEFISIVTHPRIFKAPTPLPLAFASIEAWQAAGNLLLLAESEGYLPKLKQCAAQAEAQGPLIHDARVAALCLHHGVRELWSADRDFRKFSALRVRNPLLG
jgi:uncharacterized protein